jgi:MinD superfamily P-loop ATPase
LFVRVKDLFDPQRLFNPGKKVFVAGLGMADNLRYGADYRRVRTHTAFDDEALQTETKRCHGCGSCTLACPEKAIHEEPSPIGVIEAGEVDKPPMGFMRGVLNVGEASATPMVRELKHRIDPDGITIVDAPPGNSCPVVESMRKSDFVILVTEPTPFGLHDLKSAVQIAREEMNLPVGVVINRDGIGDDGVDRFCAESSIPVILRIPMDRRIAEAYSDGVPLVEALPEYREAFRSMYRWIQQEVAA